MARRDRIAELIRVADKFSKVVQYLSGIKDFGEPDVGILIVTAQNPQGVPEKNPDGTEFQVPKPVNKLLNQGLREDLASGPYTFFKQKGSYGKPEDSFVLYGVPKSQAPHYAREYNQASVLWSGKNAQGQVVHYLLDRNGQFGEGEKLVDIMPLVSDVQNEKDYYSEIEKRKYKIPFSNDDLHRRVPIHKSVRERNRERARELGWDKA